MSNPGTKNLTKGKDGFGKNPQNINRKGRPKKSFRLFTEKMESEGVEPLSKSQLINAYRIIFNCNEDELREIAKDKDQPYALRLIIQELNDKRLRAKAMQDYREFCFREAENTQIIYNVDVSPEKAQEIAKALDNEY